MLSKCRALGATVTVRGDRLKVRAAEPLPARLVVGLKELKPQLIIALQREQHKTFDCWVLEEWRRVQLHSVTPPWLFQIVV